MGYRQRWSCAAAKFLTSDLVDVSVLAADFFSRTTALVLELGRRSSSSYVVADVGSVGGDGCLRAHSQGWSVNAARKTAMLICAVR